MDDDLQRIIRRALDDARASGGDYLTQTERAVRAACEARPGMAAPDALAAVRLAMWS